MSTPAAERSSPSVKSKLLALSQTIQFSWFIGHVVTLTCGLLYVITSRSGGLVNSFFYRLAYLGVIESFGIILYQTFKNRRPNLAILVHDDNAQYTYDAILWFLAPKNILSLAPFLVFSLFHVLGYVKNHLLPIFNSNGGIVNKITSFITTNNDKSLTIVANLEFGLLIILIFKALLFFKRSWIILAAYVVFMKLRYEKSGYSKSVFKAYEVRIDGIFADPRLPNEARYYWAKVKQVLGNTLGVPLTGGVPTAKSR